MHRATPANSSFRGYSAGGSRATVDKMDDGPQMQEMSGNMMKGESRSKVEAPQNYGFTSANHGKDDSGSAECVMHFMGGNRSFPTCGPVDDRRHRVKGLPEGDSCMHRGSGDAMQIQMSSDGLYHSAPQQVRMQLVPAGSGKVTKQSSGGQSGGSQPQAGTQAAGGGNGASGGQQGGGKEKLAGQKSVKDDGKDSKDFIHVKSAEARLSSAKMARLSTGKEDDDVLHEASNGKNYVGGTPAKHKFSKILTLAGPSQNGLARIGG